MEVFSGLITKLHNALTKQQRCAIISVYVFGFLAHGYFMMNNFIYFDATSVTGCGTTFSLGRWALGMWEKVTGRLLGNVQLPLFSTVLAVTFIAIVAAIVVTIFKVRNNLTAAVVGGIMVVFPVVTSTLGFLFTAPPYFCGLMFAVIAAGVIIEKQSIIRMLIAALVLATAVGFYQAYFPVAVTIILVYLVLELLSDKLFADVVKEGLFMAGTLALGMVFYIILSKVLNIILGISSSGYQGVETMGKLNLATLPTQFVDAYKDYFRAYWQGMNNVLAMKILVIIGIALVYIAFIYKLIKSGASVVSKIVSVIFMLLFPLSVNLIYLMINPEESWVHGLMIYANVFTFIFPVLIFEKLEMENVKDKLTTVLSVIVAFCVMLTSVFYIHEDNKAYLRMSLIQNQLDTFYTALITRMQNTEGFRENMYVVYAGGIFDETFYSKTGLDDTKIYQFGFQKSQMLNNDTWKTYMKLHTGYEFIEVGEEERNAIMATEEFANLKAYPSDNSTAVINDVLVVKFSE